MASMKAIFTICYFIAHSSCSKKCLILKRNNDDIIWRVSITQAVNNIPHKSDSETDKDIENDTQKNE